MYLTCLTSIQCQLIRMSRLSLAALDTPLSSVRMLSVKTKKRPVTNEMAQERKSSGAFLFPVLPTNRWGRYSATRAIEMVLDFSSASGISTATVGASRLWHWHRHPGRTKEVVLFGNLEPAALRDQHVHCYEKIGTPKRKVGKTKVEKQKHLAGRVEFSQVPSFLARTSKGISICFQESFRLNSPTTWHPKKNKNKNVSKNEQQQTTSLHLS